MEFVNCPVCLSCDHKVLYHAVDRMHGLSGVFRYVRCNKCGHIFLNPRLETQVIKNYYPSDYGPHQALTASSKETPISRYLSPQKRMESFLRKHITEATSILDVGCGRGDFLGNLRKETGCQCYGIDFSPNAVKTAKELYGLAVFCGQLSDAPYPDRYFDLITMWWYLEHDPYPLKTLLKCKELLRENGWLVFGVPNSRSFNAKLFRTRWFHLDAPRHLSIFSPKSIKSMMEYTGFLIDHLEWDRSAWGLVGSLQYLAWGKGYDVPFNIPESLFFRSLCFPLTVSLSLLRLSDIVTVYARPK